MILQFEEFIDEKKITKVLRFVDAHGNELTNLNDEFSNIDPDTIDLVKFANEIFSNNKKVQSVLVQIPNYTNDEFIEKYEVSRTNPNTVLEF